MSGLLSSIKIARIATGTAGDIVMGAGPSNRYRVTALLIALILVCWIGLGLIGTQEPIQASAVTVDAKRAELRVQMERLHAELASLTTTPRLRDALEKERVVAARKEQEVSTGACSSKCVALLQAQALEAAREVGAALAELDAKRAHIGAKFDLAAAALSRLPKLKPLPSQTNRVEMKTLVPNATVIALLGGGALGLVATFLAFASGHQRSPALRATEEEHYQLSPKPKRAGYEQLIRFVAECIDRADAGYVARAEIEEAYLHWARTKNELPLGAGTRAVIIDAILSHMATDVIEQGASVFVSGIRVRPPSAAPHLN